MRTFIAITCICFLLLPSCARQNKILKYYKMELENKNKTVKEWDDATFQHVDGFDLITERSKVLAQKKVKMVAEFMKENSKLFYDYSVVVDQKNMDVDWKKPGNERARFEAELSEARLGVRKALRSRFRAWNDCVRISVSLKSSPFSYDFLEGREIKKGVFIEFSRLYPGLENEPNYGMFTFTYVFHEDTTKSLDHFLVIERVLSVDITVPIVYQDNYIGDLTAEFYKL